MTRRRHAEIAGAGIAGLASAIGLAMRGWSVRLHERSAAIRTDGAGIYIWDNGLRVLAALGAEADATRGCHMGVMRETRDDRNRTVARAVWGREPGHRVVSIVRAQLLSALIGRARSHGVDLRFGSEIVSATSDGVATLADGTSARADLIVGADGINSRVRDGLGLLESRSPLGDGAIRVMIDRRPEERTSAEGSKYVEYWSGFRRILYTPVSDDQIYLALTTLDDDIPGKTVPLRKDVWTKSFPHVADLIARIGEDGRWDRFEVVKLRRWFKGRVAIVGDAAHAMAPNLGQGGGCALMNGLALAVALEGPGDIEAQLAEWERRERPLTEHTQRISSFYSRVTTMPPLLRALVLAWAGRSSWAMEQRLRTARHVPTGT